MFKSLIYIVYSSSGLSNRLTIHEFFAGKKEAELFIKTSDFKDSLDIFYFLRKIHHKKQFIKGFYREILFTDDKLIEFFSSLLEHYTGIDENKSLQGKFNSKIIKNSIKEMKHRLKLLEKIKETAC